MVGTSAGPMSLIPFTELILLIANASLLNSEVIQTLSFYFSVILIVLSFCMLPFIGQTTKQY